jgi:multicomponent K+:H+ antiporter subunit E
MMPRSGRISPLLVLALLAIWLLLNQSLAPAQILLGIVLAVALAWASSTLRPLHARVRRLDVAAALLGVVLLEVMKSNLQVARIVLGLKRDRAIRPGFLDIPLQLRDPHGLAALAVIITATPGTVWSGLSADGATLTLHILDLDDEQRWIGYIKGRFEAPLRRIFE